MRTTRFGQSALLLIDVIEVLRQDDLDYAVIGAVALAVHGEVRASRDADALLCLDSRRLRRLQERFASIGFRTVLRPAEDQDPVLGVLILSDAHGNQVDLLGGLVGMDPGIFARAFEVPFGGTTVRIVSREDFIAMKCSAGGPQDLIDARSAYRAAQSPLNLDLVRTLSRRFGRDAADRLERVLAE